MRFISFVISYFHKFSKKGTYVTREMLHILLLGYHKKTGPSPEPVNYVSIRVRIILPNRSRRGD